jgi:hypothetical protein
MADRLDEMRAAVSYIEQQLYIAKNLGLGLASPARISGLERALATSAERLRTAERDTVSSDPD